MTLDAPHPVPRRLILTGLLGAAAAPALSGCGIRLEGSVAPARPDADEKARRAVVRRLRSADAVALAMNPNEGFAETLHDVRSVFAVQLAALAADSATPSAEPTRTVKNPTPHRLLSHAVSVRDASMRRLDSVSGPFARRLAGIAAGTETASAIIGREADLPVPKTVEPRLPRQETKEDPSASPSPVSTSSSEAAHALHALGAGLFAAIYGYEVLTVRLTGSTRRIAAARLGDLRSTARDVNGQLRSGDADPAHPKPGYSLPYAVDDAASALRLAGALEHRLGLRIGAAIAALPAGTRADAAHWLFSSALAGRRLAGALPAVPGSNLPKRVKRSARAGAHSPSRRRPAGSGGATPADPSSTGGTSSKGGK